jgi:hypothetical protein
MVDSTSASSPAPTRPATPASPDRADDARARAQPAPTPGERIAQQTTPGERLKAAPPESPPTRIEALRKEPTTAERLADKPTDPTAATAGVAGAQGREGVVQGQMQRAYQAGLNAPQEAYDGTVHRGVGKPSYEATALDHTRGNAPNRYKSGTERLIYTSPDLPSAKAEAGAYQAPGQAHPLAGKSVIESRFAATPDAHGRGGVADLKAGLDGQGLSPRSITEPKGGSQPGWAHQITGEHPYSMPQQAAKGAVDAGATAIKAPSAVADHQINIVPSNAQPNQLTPTQVTRYDAAGVPSAPQSAAHVAPMPANDLPVTPGALAKPAGVSTGPSVANEGAHLQANTPSELVGKYTNHAESGYPRAGSGRYGASGGAITSIGIDTVTALRGGDVSATDVAQHAGVAATEGYVAARTTDVLANRGLGMVKAGAVVTAAIETAHSGYTNYQAYQRGEISGSRAVANTAVDTGVAVASGLAAAKAGAVIGTMVGGPLGTAAGAAIGFVAGTAVYLGVSWLANHSGVAQAAKDGLTSAIDGAGSALKGAADSARNFFGGLFN